jgi:hypothetical protein
MQHRRHNSSGRVISSSPRSLPDNIQQSQQIDIRIRIHSPSKEAAPDPWLRQRGHWDLQFHSYIMWHFDVPFMTMNLTTYNLENIYFHFLAQYVTLSEIS